MFGVRKFFFKEINTFIHQGYMKIFKSNSKHIRTVTKVFISNKFCSFECSILES